MAANSSGVFGLRGVSLAATGSSATQVVTSTDRNVYLDQGTRMLIGTQAGAAGQNAGQEPKGTKPSSPRDSQPDKR
jgi:hypothetical protein